MSERQTTGLLCFVLAGAFLLVCLLTASAMGATTQPSVETAKLPTKVAGSIEDKNLDEDPGDKSTDGWWQTILALGLVVVLILAARFALQRFGGGARLSAGPIEVLTRVAIGARQQLMLVRFGERLILIGSSTGSLTTLAEASDPEEIKSLLGGMRKGASGANQKKQGDSQ